MFRIFTAFENDTLKLLKIEGEIPEQELAAWNASLAGLLPMKGKQLILDFCETQFLHPRAVRALIQYLNNDVFLLNCPPALANIFHSSGMADRILERSSRNSDSENRLPD